MLAALRRARYGYLLALHVLLLCAAGKRPTEIASFLFCSRSTVYRTVEAYRAGTLGFDVGATARVCPPVRTTVLVPWLRHSLFAQAASAPLRVVPHPLEWRRAGRGTQGSPSHRGLG